MTKWYSMFLTQQWLRHDGDHSVWFVVGVFLVVSAWVGLVYYFHMLTWYTWYLDWVTVSICACFYIRLGTALITVVLTPWMKLVRIWFSVLRSSPNLQLPSSVMALPAREFTQLHYSCHGIVPQEKLLVTVAQLQKYVVLKKKKRSWSVGRSYLSELPIPAQTYIERLVQKSIQNTGSVYHQTKHCEPQCRSLCPVV